MKKTLAIILSSIMLIGMMPFASFAADNDAYDRAAVAANDEAYIDSMNAEQIASVILDWVDREIAKYSAEFKDAVTGAVLENGGFEEFEAFLGKDALGNIIAEQVPDITSLDGVIAYKDYLTELGGDFASLDASKLITRAEAGSAIGFINGVFEFMAANSETFGKVFRWDGYVIEDGIVTDYGNVFDYGKVGDYIETLKDSENADEKAIYDFYIDYLVGNDIQSKFVNWIATQMGYTPAEGETFDEVLDNGIMAWFSGLCEANGILSEEGLAALRAYDLKTENIYALVKNFVALVQSDNQVKIDTYYNYLLDTVVRTLIKTMLGQKAVVGAAKEVPAGFTATYADLALLEEISGGTAYYYDGTDYYEITIAGGAASAKALTWENALDVEFNPPVVGVYTGATDTADAVISNYNCDLVQEYKPAQDYTMTIYSTYADQINSQLGEMPEGMTANITADAIPEEISAIMVDENAKAMKDLFAVKVDMGETNLLSQVITFEQIRAAAETKALEAAQQMGSAMIGQVVVGATIKELQMNDVSIDLAYNGYATTDEFICQVTSTATADVKLVGSMNVMGMDMEVPVDLPGFDVSSYINNPVATIVLDNLDGDLEADLAANLPDYIEDDFEIDADLLDFAGYYDKYNGVVGQANRLLVDLTNMLLTPEGEAAFDLAEGNNDNFTANLQKVCDTANSMMAKAEELLNDAGLQELIKSAGIDFDALVADLPLDLLYAIDFSSVEALWVSVITLGLDLVDDGSNEVIAEIHARIGDLTNLDAMAVAAADYVLADCIPALNTAFAESNIDFALTVPAKSDAAAVADGAAKDIIMTKLVDLAYEAAVEGVALVNAIANDVLAKASEETGMELPTVAFELGVTKGADWKATLAALVNRVYELADGIIIACAEKPADTFDAISKVVNDILPLGSLASNCAANGYAFDINTVMGYLFDDALEGDLDGFLRLFETAEKTEDVAATCSVTEALINASEHIVDAFFPDTVKAELYVGATSDKFTQATVQEYFTSAENDQLIASNNMDSINALKADLVPAVLNLVREAGVLPFFAKCDKDHTAADLETVVVEKGYEATCSAEGRTDKIGCAICHYVVSGGETIAKNNNHKNIVNVKPVAATCTKNGSTAGTKCNDCGTVLTGCTVIKAAHTNVKNVAAVEPTCTDIGYTAGKYCEGCKTYISGHEEIAATGHVDADNNNACDTCGAQIKAPTFFDQIKAFFQRIIDWFKSLFGIK